MDKNELVEFLANNYAVGYFFVVVGLFHGGDDFADVFAGADHFHFVFGFGFGFAGLAEVGVGAFEGAELALAEGLPGATVVVADAAGAGIACRS